MECDMQNVLVVDDEDVAIAFYKTVFDNHDIGNLDTCQDGRKVMTLLSKKQFSAVLLDLNMPHISGREILKQIKEKYREMPVVVVTGEEDVEIVVECMKAGAFDFLSKPVEKNRLVSVVRHAVHQKNITEELNLSREIFRALSETATDAILQINEDLKIQFVNAAAMKIFGYEREQLLQQNFNMLFPASVYRRIAPTFKAYFTAGENGDEQIPLENTIEILGQNQQKEIITLEISFGKSKSPHHKIVTCIIRDITQRKHTERRLRHLAYHDKLTQLGNRDLFSMSLADFLTDAARYKDRIGALLFLDIDGFKKVNDTLGHDVGDMILVECSRRLRDCLRKSDHIYRFDDENEQKTGEDLFRFGGDEFIVLLTSLRSSTAAATVARKIIQEISEPFQVNGNTAIRNINLGVSVGIAVIPDNGTDINDLVSSADVAMYKAKEKGNEYAFFTKDMNNQANERLMLEDGLRRAFGKGELSLVYQPLVDKGGVIRGAEALVRWKEENGGFISPAKFIPVAEETGLIVPIGDWILNTACDFLRTCNKIGHPDFYMSINLSARQFDQQELADKITATVSRMGVNSANIKLEVTESYIMTDAEGAITKMHAIKENNPGIQIAIDDFGTGYSSLGYLTKFPVDILKIDQSFIKDFSDENNIKIVNTIINLAHTLDLVTVAEGVETKERFELLSEKECDIFQGYYFDAPVPDKDFLKLLEKKILP